MKEPDYKKAAQWIKEADGMLITAGAGMGVDSGLPDFRSEQGFWKNYPALGEQDICFEDIASPASFDDHPKLAWGFYGHRLKLYRETTPHKGFKILKEWSDKMPNGAFIFTSNVDGQFAKEGFKSKRIYECHGSIHHMQCTKNCGIFWPADTFEPEIDAASCKLIGESPKCPKCGAIARPNIAMFADFYWHSELYRRQEERYEQWLTSVDKLVVIEIGAGSSIPTVRRESVKQSKGRFIRINPRESRITSQRGVAIPFAGLHGLNMIKKYLNRFKSNLVDLAGGVNKFV